MKSATITMVGLGSGDENQLTLGIVRKLEQAGRLYLRTDKHPAVKLLQERGIRYQSFDSVYEEQETFEAVYEHITAELIRLAHETDGEIVYAVPGHPFVAERTTQLLQERCPREGIAFHALGGESFLDQVFLRFGFDPVQGFQLLDGSDLQLGMLNPRLHTIIAQVYDAYSASDVKLTLMEAYPDDYLVTVGHALGVDGEERIEQVPIFELDRIQGYGNLSLIWVPRAESDKPLNRTFGRLHEIVQILRSPEGCPWDREQTHGSLRKNLIEETYEVIETIDEDDPAHMCEELGDLLLQVMLHAQIEEETGVFTVFDVIEELNEKLIRRHPHVFGATGAEDAAEALANWNEVKAEEKRSKGIDVAAQSALSGVPRDLPSLMRAYKLQKKAAAVGFDWEKIDDVLAKVEEEIAELKAELGSEAADKRERQQEELGDLLFAVVNLSRFLKADPEESLARTNQKFMKRFSYIEEQLRLRGKNLEQTDLLEMESYWQEAKKLSKK